MGQDSYKLTGGNGGVFIDDTAAHTEGTFSAIMAVNGASAVINNSGTTSNIADFDANITITSGQILYGRFTSITLASGAVVAYYE